MSMAVFEHIYRKYGLDCDKTVSGGDSTLAFTKRVRAMLPKIVAQFELTSLLDAGCGDWRRLNLQLAPFNLPESEFIQPDGPGKDGYLAVWRLA